MKTLKFCICLCGLLFLINDTVTAQKQATHDTTVALTPQVSMEGAVKGRISDDGHGGHILEITVTSNLFVGSEVGVPTKLVVTMNVLEGDTTYTTRQTSGIKTTEHTFEIPVESGSTVYLRCGYEDEDSEVDQMTDGGCTIVITPATAFSTIP